MSVPPPLFDRALHRLRLDRAAGRYSQADFLKARVAADMVERLEAIMRSFPVAVDLGARSGLFAVALAQSPASERVGLLIETDLSAAMLMGRSIVSVPTMAMAGSFAAKKNVPTSFGAFPTDTGLFVALLVGVIVIIGGLTFFPALALGPIVEHFALLHGDRF